MKTSGKNTETDSTNNNADDLKGFEAGPPHRRLDDKAAQLESEIAALKVDSRRVHFVLSFIATAFFLLFVASVGSKAVISIAAVACLILLIGLAKFLEFPWVVVHLEAWHDAFLDRFRNGKDGVKSNEEPLPVENQNEKNA